MRRAVCLVLVLLAVAGLLFAGGGGQAAAAKPKAEVVFTFARPGDMITWDPQNVFSITAGTLWQLYYSTLVKTPSSGVYTPDLATEWSVSPDGLTWTFKLRKGVKFHNGEDFDSSSVVMTFERIMKNDKLMHHSTWAALESVSAPDAYTAVLKFKNPWSTMLTFLADAPMLPPKLWAAKGEAMFNDNIGTGPWKFSEWIPGQQIVFVRNDDYYGWGNEKSNVDKIIFKPIMEDTTRVSGVQTGDLDMVDTIPVDSINLLASNPNVKTDSILSSGIVYIGFGCDRGPFQDYNARMAVNCGIDRQLLVDTIAGGGRAATCPVGEGCFGFDPNLQMPKYDLALAKDYLAKSRYKGEKLKLIGSTGLFPRSKEIAQAMTSMLQEVGFNIELEILENALFNTRRAAGDYDILFTNMSLPSGDPENLIVNRWLNDPHKSGYVNKDMNALIVASVSEMDSKKREQILKDLFALQIQVAAPHINIYQVVNVIAYRKNISGIRYRIDNVYDYAHVMKN